MKNIGLLCISFILIIGLDQTFFYFNGHWPSHILFCQFRDCSKIPFTAHDEVGFLFDPKIAPSYIDNVGRSKKIKSHENYILNDKGFRQAKPITSDKTINVNVYGDSFTYGVFLKEGETFIDIMNKKSKICHFRNYGVPSYSLLQMIDLRHSISLVLPAQFHLFTFISDDILRMTRPFDVHSIGRTSTTYDLAQLLPIKNDSLVLNIPLVLIRNSYFFQKIYKHLDYKWWQNIDGGKVVEFFKNREQANTRMMHIPSIPDYKLGNKVGQHFYLKKGLASFSGDGFKNLERPEQYFFKHDGHPNQKGAKLIAEVIFKELTDIRPQ